MAYQISFKRFVQFLHVKHPNWSAEKVAFEAISRWRSMKQSERKRFEDSIQASKRRAQCSSQKSYKINKCKSTASILKKRKSKSIQCGKSGRSNICWCRRVRFNKSVTLCSGPERTISTYKLGESWRTAKRTDSNKQENAHPKTSAREKEDNKEESQQNGVESEDQSKKPDDGHEDKSKKSSKTK